MSNNNKLAILLPLTSRVGGSAGDDERSAADVLSGVERLAAFLKPPSTASSSSSVLVLVGIDSDDCPLLEQQSAILNALSSVGVPAKLLQFCKRDRGHECGAVCVLWGHLAKHAVKEEGCNLAVLLGE